jgi:hypothetical protein
MHNRNRIRHEFIELVPGILEPDTLYISIKYKGMVHLCFCGCGRKVVTPLSPTGWELTFDGREVSVYPSIGNWNFPCRSHYWITKSHIEWANQWTDKQIAWGYARDREAKREFYRHNRVLESDTRESAGQIPNAPKRGFWSRLKSWVS